MLYKSIIVKDRTGKEIELRNAVVQDAEALIEYLKKTNAESPYLICEPEEITLSIEQEKEIIIGKENLKENFFCLLSRTADI